MQEIFNKLEFRQFSFEEDSESVVDMHCSAHTLEGSWFDKSETCKMHGKIVVRSPGSSWVLAYNSVIFAHADLVKTEEKQAVVITWRIHENYHCFPQVAKLLFDGLKQQTIKRGCNSILIFADTDQVAEELSMIGLQQDRKYVYADTSACDSGRVLRYERVLLHADDITEMGLKSFLGSPLPPSYILHKAFMGADYAVFKHSKPNTFEIYHKENTYLACHDGREWHLFKRGNFKGEKEAIPSLLKTISFIEPSRIMLNEKALEATGITPLNDRVFHDFYHPV